MKKPATKKPATKKPAAKAKPAAKKPAAAAKKPGAATPMKKYTARADLGASIDGFFGKQPAATRPILEALRDLVREVVPDATSSLKWGMPFYEIGGATVCALGGHAKHVNLILSGPATAFADPHGHLEGAGKTGRHRKLRSLDDLDRAEVTGWLRTAAALARAK